MVKTRPQKGKATASRPVTRPGTKAPAARPASAPQPKRKTTTTRAVPAPSKKRGLRAETSSRKRRAVEVVDPPSFMDVEEVDGAGLSESEEEDNTGGM